MRLLQWLALSMFPFTAFAGVSCPDYQTPTCGAGYQLATSGTGTAAKFRCFKLESAACPAGTTYLPDCATWTSGVSHPANADGCKPSNLPGCSSVAACASGTKLTAVGVDSCELEQAPTLGAPPQLADLYYRMEQKQKGDVTVTYTAPPSPTPGVSPSPSPRPSSSPSTTPSPSVSPTPNASPSPTASAGVPGRPTVTLGSVSPVSLVVSWSPAATGGVPTSYTLKYGTNGSFVGATTLANVTSPQSITGLSPGQEYHVRVTAMNSAGSTDSLPVSLRTPSPIITAVAAGGNFSCALRSDGKVKCWGSIYNFDGLSNASAIAAGSHHACVVSSGAVKCWGSESWHENGPFASHTITVLNSNAAGELGNGTTAHSRSPVAVSGITSGATAVAAGISHTCAVVSGAVKCWGNNNKGQLGNGQAWLEKSTTPVNVSGITSGATAVAAGSFHTCAIVSGAVKCWGKNAGGELGNSSSAVASDSATPVAVSGITSGATAISVGGSYSCAVVSGAVKCWGTLVGRSLPVTVGGITSGATAVAVGQSFVCALVSGVAKCWGLNEVGQLGSGYFNNSSIPTTTPTNVYGIGSSATAFAIDASTNHACVLLSNVPNGMVRCWGLDVANQLAGGYNSTGKLAGSENCAQESCFSSTPVTVPSSRLGL